MCSISIMMLLLRYGLVRLPRSATAAPDELADSLPKVTFDPALFDDDSSAAFPAACPICFDEFDGSLSISKTPCLCDRHAFHTVCLKNWLHLQRSCPLCRHDLTQPALVAVDIEVAKMS